MGAEIPRPADDEFEQRLSWSPTESSGDRPRPSSPRPATPRTSADAGADSSSDVAALEQALVAATERIDELERALARVQAESTTMRAAFREVVGEDPAVVVASGAPAERSGGRYQLRIRTRRPTG